MPAPLPKPAGVRIAEATAAHGDAQPTCSGLDQPVVQYATVGREHVECDCHLATPSAVPLRSASQWCNRSAAQIPSLTGVRFRYTGFGSLSGEIGAFAEGKQGTGSTRSGPAAYSRRIRHRVVVAGDAAGDRGRNVHGCCRCSDRRKRHALPSTRGSGSGRPRGDVSSPSGARLPARPTLDGYGGERDALDGPSATEHPAPRQAARQLFRLSCDACSSVIGTISRACAGGQCVRIVTEHGAWRLHRFEQIPPVLSEAYCVIGH
jgi:hypothetical protein